MLAVNRPVARPARLFGLLERRCAPRPLVPPSSRRGFSLSFLDPVRERLADLIKPAPLPALPPPPPRWDGRRIPKEEFNQLLPDEQIRYALSLPVPTTFPHLGDKRLAATVFQTKMYNLTQAEEARFKAAYHRERLEFGGDRVFHFVISEMLLELSPPGHTPSNVSELQKGFFQLHTNDMAAKLASLVGLHTAGPVKVTTRDSKADRFEAFLEALYRTGGMQPVFEFLVPLLREEYRPAYSPPQLRQEDITLLEEEHLSTIDEPASTPPPSPAEQVRRAPDYSANVAEIRRMKRPEVFDFINDGDAAKRLIVQLSERDIAFSYRWTSGHVFLDVAGVVTPLAFEQKKGEPFAAKGIIRGVRKRGLINLVGSAATPSTTSASVASSTSASSAASTTPPVTSTHSSDGVSSSSPTAVASDPPQAPETAASFSVALVPSTAASATSSSAFPRTPSSVSASPSTAAPDSTSDSAAPSAPPLSLPLRFNNLAQAVEGLSAALARLRPPPVRKFSLHISLPDGRYRGEGATKFDAFNALVNEVLKLKPARRFAIIKQLPRSVLDFDIAQASRQRSFDTIMAASGKTARRLFGWSQTLSVEGRTQIGVAYPVGASLAVRTRALVKACAKAGIVKFEASPSAATSPAAAPSSSSTSIASSPPTSSPSSPPTPSSPSSPPSTSDTLPTPPTPSTSPDSPPPPSALPSVSSTTSTASTAESLSSKPLPFSFESLNHAATNLQAALQRRQYHFTVELKHINARSVYTLSVKEWRTTVRRSMPHIRDGKTRLKEKKQLPVPLIEECVKRGFVVIQEPISPSPDSPTSSFLDDFLVDSSSDNSTSIFTPSAPLCTPLSPAPPSPAPPSPVSHEHADSLSPSRFPDVEQSTQIRRDPSLTDSDTSRYGLISRDPPLFRYANAAEALTRFRSDLEHGYSHAVQCEISVEAPGFKPLVGYGGSSLNLAWANFVQLGVRKGYFVKGSSPSTSSALPMYYNRQAHDGRTRLLRALRSANYEKRLTFSPTLRLLVPGYLDLHMYSTLHSDVHLYHHVFDVFWRKGFVEMDDPALYSSPEKPAFHPPKLVLPLPSAPKPSNISQQSAPPRLSPRPDLSSAPPAPPPPPDQSLSYHELLAFYSSSSSAVGDSPDLSTSVDLAEVEPVEPVESVESVETPSSDELDAELAELAAIEALLEPSVEVDESDKSAFNAQLGVEATTGSPGDEGETAESTPARVEVEQEEQVEVDSVAVERPAVARIEAQGDDATKVGIDSRVEEEPVGELEEEMKPERVQ